MNLQSSTTFFIDYNGEVQMCSHYWGKKHILGNVNEHFIAATSPENLLVLMKFEIY